MEGLDQQPALEIPRTPPPVLIKADLPSAVVGQGGRAVLR